MSRASVANWNCACIYPYYEDLKSKNIRFDYRQKGFDCSYVSTNFKPFKGVYSTNSAKAQDPEGDSNNANTSEDQSLDSVKCRINLKFTHEMNCYITPLTLTSLERAIKSFKSCKVNPNYLITKMQTKSQASFAQDSIIDVISKTQISMKIPRILVCSLQCGLAEGDKVANAFSTTLASPEEFMSLSLFTICIQSVQTQVIDSQDRSAAIFMIDKIESQFCRLYENDKTVFNGPQKAASAAQLPTSNVDYGAQKIGTGTSRKSKTVKLSCISNEHSKTSIKCFKVTVLFFLFCFFYKLLPEDPVCLGRH